MRQVSGRLAAGARALLDPAVAVPLVVAAVFAWPSVNFLLPSYQSMLGEDYQPLMALKFYATLGADQQKYGPMSNYLLGPTYAASIAWWWLTGAFTSPSGDFPYGLRDPLHQLSWLLWHGRVLFLLLFLALAAFSMRALRVVVASPGAIAIAFVLCVATDYALTMLLANTRPDGPMYAFALASLGIYAQIIGRGLTLARGAWLSIAAVAAISSKELAGPMYVLPYLALGISELRATRGDPERRRAFWRCAAVSIAVGVGMYLLLNVLYSPSTWLWRMSHWLVGQGTDSAVWGGIGSGAMTRLGFVVATLATYLNTLGPGGVVVVALALGSLAWLRSRVAFFLVLPFVSLQLLGLAPMGYVGDRFHALAGVALFPFVAFVLARWQERWRTGSGRALLSAGLALAVLANLVFGTFAWHFLEAVPERAIERSLAQYPVGERLVYVLNPSAGVAGKSRLDWLGYRRDPRSLQQVIEADPADRPGRIYAAAGLEGFITEAKHQPARAAVLFAFDGLDVSKWNGVEALGYTEIAKLEASTPAWFPFAWMPAVRSWRTNNAVHVYDRNVTSGSD